MRLLENREIARPVVPAIARNRHESARVGTDGRNANRLPPDVSGNVGPDHVLAWNVAVATGIAEFFPRLCLVHAQRRHVRCAAGLEPRRAHRVRKVPNGVFVHDRAVPRVLERDVGGRLPLYSNPIADRAHRLPRALVLILRMVRRVGLVDVEVLTVGFKHGEPPRAVLVVPDRDAGDNRLATTDHVPAGRVQMHEVAERGRGDRPVRIVGHEGTPTQRVLPAHDPVVAADVAPLGPAYIRVRNGVEQSEVARVGCVTAEGDLDVGRLEAHGRAERVIQGEDGCVETCAVDHRIEIDLGRDGSRMKPLDLLQQGGTVVRYKPAVRELFLDVAQQALVTRDHDVGRPSAWCDAQHAKLGGDECRIACRFVHIGVHAVYEGTDDRRAARMVARQVGSKASPILEQSRTLIALQLARANHLGHRARRLASPHLELECPIARRGIALREEEIVLVLRVDVGHPPPVAQHFHRLNKARDTQGVGTWRLRDGHASAGCEKRRHERAGQAGSETGHHRNAPCLVTYCLDRPTAATPVATWFPFAKSRNSVPYPPRAGRDTPA